MWFLSPIRTTTLFTIDAVSLYMPALGDAVPAVAGSSCEGQMPMGKHKTYLRLVNREVLL